MTYKIGVKVTFKEYKLKQYGIRKGEVFTIIETKKKDKNNTYVKIENNRISPKYLIHTNILKIATDKDILEDKLRSPFIK
jgi:hypothetical protein